MDLDMSKSHTHTDSLGRHALTISVGRIRTRKVQDPRVAVHIGRRERLIAWNFLEKVGPAILSSHQLRHPNVLT